MTKNKKKIKLILVFACSFAIYLCPFPNGLSQNAWHLFAIFIGTLGLIVFDIFPMGAASIIGLTVSIFSGSLTFEEAFSGFTSPITWLILSAFFISFGFVHTGLGSRIAFWFIAKFGHTPLGLAYSIAATELLLAPGTPSSTSRTGGIIFPVVGSIARSFDSYPENTSREKIGSYLILVLFHCSVVTSTMFMTAMAANPFAAKMVQDFGFEITWATWAIHASVPGIINLILVPIVLYKLFPPKLKDTHQAAKMATTELNQLGPMKRPEKLMALGFLLLMALWILGPLLNIPAAVAALLGLCFLLVFDVIKWQQLLHQHSAFETFIWFGALLALAQGLSDSGFTSWFGIAISNYLQSWPSILGIAFLFFIYFYSHYFFASCTAHVGAMFLPFLAGAIALGAEPLQMGLLFCYASSLMGGLTHYGNGPAPVLFGSGYVSLSDWWKYGFIMSLISIGCFLIFGSIWWYILGI